MKKKIYLIHIILIWFVPVFSFAQYKAITIGDTIPDIHLQCLTNFHIKNPSTKDFRGKLLILDFWTSGCATCIADFPRLEKIQSEFGDQIQILLLNPHESKKKGLERLKALKKRESKIKLPTLPYSIGDTIWKDLFPHRTLPHHVWIDKNGIVVAITDGFSTTDENINRFIKTGELDVSFKKDLEVGGFNIRQLGGYKPTHNAIKPLFFSAVSKYTSGLGAVGNLEFRDTVNKTIKRVYSNRSILALYHLAADQTPHYKNELRNRQKYNWPKDLRFQAKWRNNNLYSYEICIPIEEEDSLQTYMLDDLNRSIGQKFGIEGAYEIRKIDCIILKENNAIAITPLSTSDKRSFETNGKYYIWKNYKLQSIINFLRNRLENMDSDHPIAFLDETKKQSRAKSTSMRLPIKSLYNIEMLNIALSTYGLSVNKEQRKIKMFILRNK